MLQNERQVFPMKMTYKVLRNDEGKIIDRGFYIEVENKGESEKLTKVFCQEYGKKYYTFENKVTFISYDKTVTTLKLFKAKITRLFIEADTMEVISKKPVYTAKNTVKKVRRRNKQLAKALNLMGKAGKEEKIINSLFHRGGTLAFVA